MIDACGREIDHLRVSLTDRCNMACRYCVPKTPAPSTGAIDPGFAVALVRWLARRHGIRHVRLTGGEPLLYRDLIRVVRELAGIDELHEVTLTTNGQALARHARPLREAGLDRLNASLDTLNPERFAHLTRGGILSRTLAGIEAAVSCGLTPVKINVVAQRNLNDDELPDLAQWGLSRGCVVRFLEVMPIGPSAHVMDEHLVPASEILARLGERFELHAIAQSLGQPAVDYVATGQGLRGVLGLIAPTTRPFCSRCRRIRITHDGHLVACVHDGQRLNLAECWHGDYLDTDAADRVLEAAVRGKPEVGPRTQTSSMLSLGG